jgi:hypothetical protein
MYISSDAPKKVKDVVAILEKDPNWLSHKQDEVKLTFVFFNFSSLFSFLS